MTSQAESPDRIKVALGERSYDIVTQPGVLANPGPLIASVVKGRRCLVVTDQNAGPKYGPAIAKSLQLNGFDGSIAQLPAGESNKTFKTAEFLYDHCLDAKLDRDSCLIALGGGVIGDLAGFVAATFYRGISFVQAPTTLLAMVDASIGGKTGIDHPRAKNAIGAFHQPKLVLIDPDTLSTLPDRELRAGLAEVIKYGVIDDAALFTFVEHNIDALLAKDPQALAHVIRRSAAIKARIVSEDERELAGGPRALLNFGHTFGHAIETATEYQGYLHGEAVAIGMVMASELSVALNLLSQADRERIEALIARAGLPVKLRSDDPDAATLQSAALKDKKAASGKLRFIVAEKIGAARVVTDVPEATTAKIWNMPRR